MTISLNRRGLNDHSSIIKALAKLASHQVSVDLSPLYMTANEISKKAKISTKKVTLGGHNIIENILTAENKQLFQNQPETNLQTVRKADVEKKVEPAPQAIKKPATVKTVIKQKPTPQPQVKPMKIAVANMENKTEISKKPAKTTSYLAANPKKLASTLSVNNTKTHYQKINANNLMVHQTHSTFLQSRQDFSQQLSEIIQLQIACAEHLFDN